MSATLTETLSTDRELSWSAETQFQDLAQQVRCDEKIIVKFQGATVVTGSIRNQADVQGLFDRVDHSRIIGFYAQRR